MTALKPIFKANSHVAKSRESPSNSTASAPAFTLAKAEDNAQILPHFINITNSLYLDDSSKSEVRIQVMREYHRRRKQGKASRAESRLAPKAPLSAKSQTQKFRLGREKILRPWVRVKPYVSKKAQTASTSTGITLESENEVDRNEERTFNKRSSEFSSVETTDYNNPTFIDCEGATSEIEILRANRDKPMAAVQQWMESSLQAFSPYNSPAAGVLDPFSAMSLAITPRTQLLLHHYFNVRLASSWLMMPMRKGLFSLAVHDAALFHTFMSHYVASYNLRFSTGDPTESMQHRTEAIRIVNERLQDPSQALNDGTIAAVANMAVYESSNGSTKSMIVHLNGLVEMVNMRGGIQNGGFAPHVRRLIGWTDLHVASALSSKPRFPPLGIPLTEVPDSTSLPFPTDPHTSDFPTRYQFLSTDETLAHIRTLSSTMSILRKQSVVPEENIWYSDKIYSLQHRLYFILHNSPFPSSLDPAMCIAALIFCAVCLRDITFNFRIIYNGVKRLKTAVQVFLDRHWKPCVDYALGVKLFWVLGMGGIASEGKEERNWFVGKFKIMCGVLNLKNWEDARGLLEGVLWQEDLNGFGGKLWLEAWCT